MGRELAKRRHAAGLSQAGLAAHTGRYSRTVVSHAETGRDDVGRAFWEAADRLLGTGDFFTASYDMTADTRHTRAAATAGEPYLATDPAMTSGVPRHALRAYRQRCWPVHGHEESMRLLTGQAADALAVGHIAGRIAAATWEQTGGAESAARGIPRLPPSGQALAVINAGTTWYFLVAPGSCPWPGFPLPPPAPRPHLRWHSAGGSIPLPPRDATWARLPLAGIRLPPPHAVLDLLGWAAAMVTGPHTLTLRGTITIAPARNS
jgi:transcriptional regulator with XRE-family HTH domain